MNKILTKGCARLFLPWVLPVLTIAAWQAAGDFGLLPRGFVPTPYAVLRALLPMVSDGSLFYNIAVSTLRAFAGFLIGGSAAFLVGFLNGYSAVAERFSDTFFQMLRTVPNLALIPLIILIFGIGEGPKIALIAIGVFFPVYINTFFGVKYTNAGLIEMGRVYGLSRAEIIGRIILPGASARILTGVRYSLSIMWCTLIVAETVSVSPGIGLIADTARRYMQMDRIFLCVLLYAVLGKLSDSLTKVLERILLKWDPNFAIGEK